MTPQIDQRLFVVLMVASFVAGIVVWNRYEWMVECGLPTRYLFDLLNWGECSPMVRIPI